MSKIDTLTDLANLQNETTAVNAINGNNTKIEAALNNTVSRDGSTPNQMQANLDMNSNRIVNLPAASSSTEPVRKAEFDLVGNDYVGNDTILGTNNEITVTGGAGTITLSIPSAVTFTGKTITGGTYSGASSYNKVNITAPATTATLTLANNSTLTTLGNATLSGTNTGDVLTLPTGRISASSTSSLTPGDATGVATIYYVDCGGGTVPIWDAVNSVWVMRSFSGSLSLALDSNPAHFAYQAANQCFDVYAYWDSSLGSIRLGITAAAGTDFSQRGVGISGIALKNGIWVNNLNGFLRNNAVGNVAGVDYIQPGLNAATYLGSIGTVLAGQTEDSMTKRLIFNAYNPKPRPMVKKMTAASYAYSAAAYRQVNADVTNQLEFVLGLDGVMVDVNAEHNFVANTVPAAATVSIYDSGTGLALTNALMGTTGVSTSDTARPFSCKAWWRGYPSLGRRYYIWMESGTGVGTMTWQQNGDLTRNGITMNISGM